MHYGLFSDVFLRPRGLPGRIGGWIMTRTSNHLPGEAVAALQLGEAERVIEVGCGPGLGLAEAAKVVSHGLVVGVDPSRVMREQAARRNQSQMPPVKVVQGTAGALPFDDESFDAAFSTNSFQLWPDPKCGASEVRRVLRPGGRVLIALSRYAWPLKSPDIQTILESAGFEDVRRISLPSAREAFAATKPSRIAARGDRRSR